jgi:hypothetical protein
MDFKGRVPLDFGGADSGGYGIYNLSEGVLALANWYPILAVYDQQGWNLDPVSYIGDSVYSDTASYTVTVSAPADLVIAATGAQVDRQVNGKVATTRFESGPMQSARRSALRRSMLITCRAASKQPNRHSRLPLTR